MPTTQEIEAQLDNTLSETNLPIGEKYSGKVRDSYILKGKRIMIVTDRISCFDKIIGTVPFKGQVLNQMAQYWFDSTKDIVANHVIDVPDPNVMVVKECKPLMVEVVVRGYITGSLWRDYASGKRHLYGLRFTEGLGKNDELPMPIITPTTKAEHGQHDLPISKDELLRRKLAAPKQWEKVENAAFKLFERGTSVLKERNLILVDTKYEFGFIGSELVLMDEIHTPDSSRFWYLDSYPKLLREGLDQKAMDKEYVRQWLLGHGFSGEGEAPQLPKDVRVEAARRYIEVYEQITGKEFQAIPGRVDERIRNNLAPYFLPDTKTGRRRAKTI